MGDTVSQPPPSPPSTRKEDIFKEEDYKCVDLHVMKALPELIHGSWEDVRAFLTSNKDLNDVAKIRAIFLLIASVDINSLPVKNSQNYKDDALLACFYKIRSDDSFDYDNLLAFMCGLASIPCVTLTGTKKFSDDRIGDGYWNAVYVAGSWRLIDQNFASSCLVGKKTGEWAELESDGKRIDDKGGEVSPGIIKHRVDEFYFLTDPDMFIWDHFPLRTEWQLLKTPVTSKQFFDHFYVDQRFFELGMTNTSATKVNYIVKTTDGETDFTFGLPESQSVTYRFSYTFYRAQHVQSDKELKAVLDRFVMFEQREDLLRFSLRFPIIGMFKLAIYGEKKGQTGLALCCSHVISCLKKKEGCLPLPDCPKVGWGPGPATKAAGLKPLTHKQAKIPTKDGCIEIRLCKEKPLAFHQILKHFLLDEATLSKHSVTELDGDEAVVYLRLPQKGEYALKLFAQELDEKGTAPNVLNYLVNCDQEETHSERFPNVTTGKLGRNEINSEELGVKALSYTGGKFISKNGKMSLDFEVTSDIMELVCEMHTMDGVAASKMTNATTNVGKRWTFDLDMPVNGEYSINVFARRKDDPAQVFHVHTYLIKSFGRSNGRKTDSKATSLNISVPTETLETSDLEITVPFPPDVSRATAAVHKCDGNEVPDSSTIKFLLANDKNQFKVKLKDYGEYMLNVYSVDDTRSIVQNVFRYHINRKRPSELSQKSLKEIMECLKATQEPMPPPTPATTPVEAQTSPLLQDSTLPPTDECRNGETGTDQLWTTAETTDETEVDSLRPVETQTHWEVSAETYVFSFFLFFFSFFFLFFPFLSHSFSANLFFFFVLVLFLFVYFPNAFRILTDDN